MTIASLQQQCFFGVARVEASRFLALDGPGHPLTLSEKRERQRRCEETLAAGPVLRWDFFLKDIIKSKTEPPDNRDGTLWAQNGIP